MKSQDALSTTKNEIDFIRFIAYPLEDPCGCWKIIDGFILNICAGIIACLMQMNNPGQRQHVG